jgi:hypothetical protein
MKKKAKRFQDGGVADENFTAAQLEFLGGADRTDPYILARMPKAVPDKKPMNSEMGDDSPAGKSGYGEENEMPTTTKVTKTPAKTTATKPSVKPVTVKTKEVVVEKEEPKKSVGRDIRNEKQKAAGEEPSFLRGTKGYNLSDITGKIKAMLPEGSDRRTEKQKAAGEEPSFLRGTKGYNLPDFKMPEGSDRRTEKQKAAGEEPSFLRGTKGYNLSDFKMKEGGKVSSASKRADGCAIRGKTRA